jgi:hypothetical protein
MVERQARVMDAGLILGAAYGLAAVLVGSGSTDARAVAVVAALVPAGLGLVQLAFTDSAQMEWFRGALFIPIVASVGALLLVAAAIGVTPWPQRDSWFMGLSCMVAIGAFVTVILAPLVWLPCALYLRYARSRQRRLDRLVNEG